MSRNISTVWFVARSEYVRWVTNPRMIIVLILLIIINTIVTDPLSARAEKFGAPMNLFEPFIAVTNSPILLLLIPSVFFVLMSDFPSSSENMFFLINRTGKINWMIGQLLFAFMAAASFMAVIFIGTLPALITKDCFIGADWSDVTRLYLSHFPKEYDSFVSQLLPANLYNQMYLSETLVHTCLMLLLYLFSICAMLFVFKMLKMKAAGLLTSAAILAAGVTAFTANSVLMWIFPSANMVVWVHFQEILAAQVFPLWASYLYFAVFIAVMIILGALALKKVNFYSTEER